MMIDLEFQAIEGFPVGEVPLFTLGEMRLMNMKIPVEFSSHTDDCTLLLPYWRADQVFHRVLTAWEIPAEEIEKFKSSANIVDVKHTIQISRLLEVMQNSVNTLEWLHADNLHFDSTNPWSQIKKGNAATVF